MTEEEKPVEELRLEEGDVISVDIGGQIRTVMVVGDLKGEQRVRPISSGHGRLGVSLKSLALGLRLHALFEETIARNNRGFPGALDDETLPDYALADIVATSTYGRNYDLPPVPEAVEYGPDDTEERSFKKGSFFPSQTVAGQKFNRPQRRFHPVDRKALSGGRGRKR